MSLNDTQNCGHRNARSYEEVSTADFRFTNPTSGNSFILRVPLPLRWRVPNLSHALVDFVEGKAVQPAHCTIEHSLGIALNPLRAFEGLRKLL